MSRAELSPLKLSFSGKLHIRFPRPSSLFEVAEPVDVCKAEVKNTGQSPIGQ